jgi:Flp pilus assembly protein TadB
MGSRERKRAERRKRKRRSAEHVTTPAADSAPAAATPPPRSETFEEKMVRRSAERDAQARAELEPLEQEERPTAVTVGAIISGIAAIGLTVSAVLAAAGVEAGGTHPKAAPIAFFALVIWVMAWGMWKARYWAVLGFQMLLVLVLLASVLTLITFDYWRQAVGATILLLGSGTLFYFMIRAMARIQMPRPPGSDS